MSAEHRRIRQLLGGYALGVADPAARPAIEAHLDGCAECRAELAELDGAARRLALVSTEAGPRPPVPIGLGERLFERIAAERRRRRRRVAAATLAGAAAAAAVLVAVVLIALPDREPGRPVAFAVVPEGVTASARIEDWAWGSQVYLEITGLPAEQRLGVWLERPDGSRVSAGTFRTTTDGELQMTLGAAEGSPAATALGISNPEGETLLLAPL